MSLDSRTQPTDAPDRVFARTVGLVLSAWLALAFATTLASDLSARRAAQADAIALVGAGVAVSVRQVAEGFRQLANLPEGPDRQTARAALGWDIERLAALDARAAELGAGTPALAQAARDAAAANREGLAPAEARLQHDLFAARLAPQAERSAIAAEAAAERARAQPARSGGAGALRRAPGAGAGAVLGRGEP